MIVIYINSEGTAQKVSPSHVYQGSNQSGVIVFAPVPPTTVLSIAFKLPDGTNSPYYPMTFIQTADGLTQYEFKISSLTQEAGQASIALQAAFTDGQQTSQLVQFEIEPSLHSKLTPEVDEDAYTLIKQYLQQNRTDITAKLGQIDNIEATADSAVNTANGAVDDIAEFKQSVDVEIEGFERKLDTIEEQISETGTIVKVAGISQKEIAFSSDPQLQLDEKVNKSGDTMSGSLQINVERQEQGGAFAVIKGTEGIGLGIDSYADKGIYDLKQDKYRLKFNDEDITSYDTDFLLKHGQTDKHAMFTAERTDTGNSIGFGVGSGGTNRGIWDNNLDKWIFHTDGDKVYVNGSEPYSSNNLPLRMKISDTRNTTATDTSTFPYYTMTPFFTNKEMPTVDWYSGIDMQGWGNGYLAWQLIGYTGNALSDDTPLYHRKVDKNGKAVGNWKTILEIDPTKLSPTTANGWTVGTNTLAIPTEGIYLVSLNNAPPFIFIYGGIGNITSAIGQVRSSVIALYKIRYSTAGSTNWRYFELASDDIIGTAPTTVAYKKLA